METVYTQYEKGKHEISLTFKGLDTHTAILLEEKLKSCGREIWHDLLKGGRDFVYEVSIDDAAFEKRFRQLYGDVWVVVKCSGIRKQQVQRNVIDVVRDLARKCGFRGDFEIEISRSVMKPEREKVNLD